MTDRYTFSRVPGFSTWTGDKRVYGNQSRTQFVAFVINLDTLEGTGYTSTVLEEVKAAVEHFNQYFKWPTK